MSSSNLKSKPQPVSEPESPSRVKTTSDTDNKSRVAWPADLNFKPALKWLGLIAGQATLVGALLFYIGWVRTQSLLNYFGLNNNIIRLPWADYVMRSPNAVIPPLTFIFAVSLFVVIAGGSLWIYLSRRPKSHLGLSLASYALAVVALVLGIRGLLFHVFYSRTIPFVPIFFVLAAALFALGVGLSSHRDKNKSELPSYHSIVGYLVVLTGLLGTFWIASVYATNTGRALAVSIEQNPAERTSVTIYSEADLGFAPPVITTPLSDSRFKQRYSGLRFLIYAPEKYVLIPEGWRRGRDPVYIIRDDPSIRVEITSSGR
jgi:hypothetical protein